MKDTKQLLKEAKEAIKNKDYTTSLKLCKSILKEDKENYMGLVFLGVSLQEIGPKDQALLAFKKAIRIDSTKILAWNGLLSYYEKYEKPQDVTELIDLYLTLIKLEESQRKIEEYGEKLVECCNGSDFFEVCKKIRDVIKSGVLKDSAVITLWKTVAAIGLKQSKPAKEFLEIYTEALETLVNNSKTRTREFYSEYLKLLHKQGFLGKLLEKAEELQKVHTYDSTVLEWICKIYNESKIEQSELSEKLEGNISEYSTRLLSIHPDSSMGLFTCAVLKYEKTLFSEAADLLQKVVSVRPGLLHAWVLLTNCYTKMQLFEEALGGAAKADRLLNSINNSNVALRSILDKLRLEILSRSSDVRKLTEALQIGEHLNDSSSLIHLIRACINFGNLEEAEVKLELLSQMGEHKEQFALLNASLLRKKGQTQEALDFLEKSTLCSSLDYFLLLGDLYWDLEMWDKSLVPYLKAAKVDPNYYVCFLRLGRYYEKVNDLEKSKRCHEKAFKLNNKNSDVIGDLSNIYRKQKDWEANITLLEHVTSEEIKNENMWAYFQLGLSYLEKKGYEKAIGCLRIVLRMNAKHSECWESLADAYLARGAYIAALKCYEKAVELTSNTLYPLLQIATIKRLLGEYSEARKDFERIVEENPDYVPALKGLAETCIIQARKYRTEQMVGLSRDCAQYALDKLTEAVKQNANVSCIWKLMGDSFFHIAQLPKRYCYAFVLKALAVGQDVEGLQQLQKFELFTLAARCFSKSLSLVEDNVLIWHDLATCYLTHACETDSSEEAVKLFDLSLHTIKHCTSVNPSYWQHWNLLGNIYCRRTPKNYALAQHAFIKAVVANNNSAIAWCNLGTLYLLLDELKLANQAFAEAQRSDPDYVNSWIGQALLAEMIDPKEAMDLFRHSTQLGVHEEGSIGYGHWVCKTLLETAPGKRIYAIHDMHAIPVACDSLVWYTESNPNNPCAWNMLGMLQERMGLKKSTKEAYAHAYKCVNSKYKDATRVNYARALTKMEEYVQAVKLYSEVEAASCSSGTGLALALYKMQEYEESYNAYETALNWLAEEQISQSDLLVALASMAYMAQGPNDAKLLLFKSIALKPPSPWALYAILSLALIHDDLKLAQLVLKELQSLKDQSECVSHYVGLLSLMYLLQEKYDEAVAEVSKMVHRHPHEASVWLTLGTLLLYIHKHRKLSTAASNCIKNAVQLGKKTIDITKVQCLVSLSAFLLGDNKTALKTAQKAVHSYPNIAENWAVLFSALSRQTNNFPTLKLSELSEFVVKNLECTSVLADWLGKFKQIN